MIAEIGLILGLYVLTRLTAGPTDKPWRRILHRGLVVVTAVSTIGIMADLIFRGTTDRSLASLLATKPQAEQAKPKDVEAGAGSTKPALIVSRSTGGGFTVEYEYMGARKVAETSLAREWIVINAPTLPVQLPKDAGIKVVYRDGGYQWSGRYSLTTRAALQAFEIKFVLFDIWGSHIQTLSDQEIVDLPADSTKRMDSQWRLFSENEMGRYYACIAYVARIRFQDGRIVEADTVPILEEIRKFSAKFQPSELEPPRPTVPGISVPAR